MNIRFFLAAAVTMLLSACVEEKIEKAAPDSNDCMGVYFVEEQENAKDHTLEKGKDKTTLEFAVRRTNAEKAAEIPYEYKVYRIVQKQEPGDTAYVEEPVYDQSKFRFGKIRFEKGQMKTTVEVSFEGIPMGERFMCSMSITDPEYAMTYGYSTPSVSFSVQMFEWTKLNGKAIYRDDFLTDILGLETGRLETSVDIYERKDRKGYYRLDNIYSASYLARLMEGEEKYKENQTALEKQYGAFVDENCQIIVDASNPEKVYIPAQSIGLSSNFMGGIVYIASDVEEVFSSNSNLLYGSLSKDGVITFPKNGILLGMSGYFYFSNTSGRLRIVLPGGKAEDYGIELTTAEDAVEGGRPVTFTLAKDVATVKYKVYKGTVNETGIADKIKDVEANGTVITVGTDESTIEKLIAPEEENAPTSIYTIVACSYGASDATYREYAKAEFGYVKPGEERKVEIYMGLHTDDRLASDKPEEDYNSRNSFQYWIRGKNITKANISYYPTAYYETYEESIKEQMVKSSSLSSAVLKVLNKDGLSGILGNTLKAGTSYTFVVYASNGYCNEFIIDTIRTNGIEDLMKKSYYLSDINRYDQPSIDSYSGAWIPVSVDIFNAESQDRAIRGNWRGKEVTLSVTGDEVKAEGLFPSLSTNPSITFAIKDGLLYSKENRCAKVTVKDSTHIIPSMRFEYQYFPRTGALSSSGYFYNTFDEGETKDRTDMFVAGFVHPDIIALADNVTEFKFWALMMGGYTKNSMGEEELSTYIGDAHGELILVRKGSPLLNSLKVQESQGVELETALSSLTESNRVMMPEIGSIARDYKTVDVSQKVEFRKDVRVRTIVK